MEERMKGGEGSTIASSKAKELTHPFFFLLLFLFFFFLQFSVSSGVGVGPEAPILVIGGATASWIGLKMKLPKKTLRILTLTGCYASLSAFFGEPVSGLYALEFPHRIGFEFFEGKRKNHLAKI